MTDLLVGSIFVSVNRLMEQWLDLQLRYLSATTNNFDHVSFITNAQSNSYFSSKTKIISESLKADVNSFSHVRGLMMLLQYFQQHRQQYRYFLFLDMDAFPIRKNWFDIIDGRMGKYEIAVPIRFENLENRLHSSILLAKPEALDHLQFNVSVGKDLLGENENDVSIREYQEIRRDHVFPLLRSNRHNLHPLLFSIYYDLFYHNGCGTGRNYNMRGRVYWSHMMELKCNVMPYINDLFLNPNKFIGKLTGDNPNLYAKV